MGKHAAAAKERIGELGKSFAELTKRGKERSKRIASTAGILGVTALVAAGCGSKETHTLAEAEKVAANKYDNSFKTSSPAGKYLLQYLRVSYADVVKSRDDEQHRNYPIDEYYQFSFNNACLGGTAYDIAGGQFKASAKADGFFSSASAQVEGEVPTAAANAIVNPENSDLLVIKSGHTTTKPLRFTGVTEADPLTPASKHTDAVLNTYGCETGMNTGHLILDNGYDPIAGVVEGPDGFNAPPTVHVK